MRWPIALLLVMVGCSPGPGPDSGSPADRTVLWEGSSVAVSVVDVIDGDSVRAEVEGSNVEIRLEGINAPERDECWGTEARQALEAALRGEEVKLADTGADQFDRRLGYLIVDGAVVNADLVDRGAALATSDRHPLTTDFVAIGDRARRSQAGMWGPGACGDHDLPDIRVESIEPDPRGRDEDRLEAELIVLINDGQAAADLSGWIVRDESSRNRYVIPDGFQLKAGRKLVIRSGCGDDGVGLWWCADQPVWNNGGDTVIVMSPLGTVVDSLRYDSD